MKMFSNKIFMAYEQQKITSGDQSVLTNAIISPNFGGFHITISLW
jgi:hypothetical protein